jgi:hypothetical protein
VRLIPDEKKRYRSEKGRGRGMREREQYLLSGRA